MVANKRPSRTEDSPKFGCDPFTLSAANTQHTSRRSRTALTQTHTHVDLLLPTRGSRSISRLQLLEHTCSKDMTRNVRVVGRQKRLKRRYMCAKARESARESVLPAGKFSA